MSSAKPTRGRHRFWRPLLIQVILILIVFSAVQAWQARHAPKGAAPLIAGQLLDGRQLSLADYQGQVVLVHFWASWCPICRFEQGSIESIAKDYPVISLASQSGDAAAVAAYVQEQDLKIPVLVDEDGELANLYGVRGFPASYIIDAEGQIADVEVGYTSEWGLRARLFVAGY
ncbi:protein disulfide oxidoreductase [Sulfuriflexus mobilis]|uniref:protein disulfide oxidoreductase n=1 Tax=Sulfuriflexus mobilis TaxID=1811807 RepID=UPI000F83B388|nr:protein disulfide oxidoreductase [Sulfuriflexus mobilis]